MAISRRLGVAIKKWGDRRMAWNVEKAEPASPVLETYLQNVRDFAPDDLADFRY